MSPTRVHYRLVSKVTRSVQQTSGPPSCHHVIMFATGSPSSMNSRRKRHKAVIITSSCCTYVIKVCPIPANTTRHRIHTKSKCREGASQNDTRVAGSGNLGLVHWHRITLSPIESSVSTVKVQTPFRKQSAVGRTRHIVVTLTSTTNDFICVGL